ncbi:MAG: hypothetical protein ACI3T9_04785 [Romboutsia timonensis]
MQQFYIDTIESKFIKQLIASTPLPTVDTLYKGKLIVAECTYVTDSCIVKAKRYNEQDVFKYDPDEFGKQLIIVSPYNFNQSYPGITSTYETINAGYDSKTHYYLGNYLRCLRDLHDIDLMPFYNCFNSTYISDLCIDENKLASKSPTSIGKKLIAIPVKFGTTYSIFIDCETDIEIACGLYGNKGNINNLTVDLTVDINYKKELATSFRDGFTYTTTEPTSQTYPYTQFLKMYIQLPLSNKSSIVVLEGDYANHKPIQEKVSEDGDEVSIEVFHTKQKKPRLLSDLSLIQISDGKSYAFSNRLIEYLTYNVITSDDSINQNISRIQTYAASNINAKVNGSVFRSLSSKGIWDKELQKYLFDLTLNSRYVDNKLDLTGYVDKDVEQVITRGQKV